MSDVLVIGSGFGGSIAAKRFTEAGHRVTILELGESWADPAKLQQSQDPAYVFRLVRDYPADYIRTKPKLRIAAGMGLGGGSLVYAGIHLRAPAHTFGHARRPARGRQPVVGQRVSRQTPRLGCPHAEHRRGRQPGRRHRAHDLGAR
jgi:choline dehydrogenase-like flavoprotein